MGQDAGAEMNKSILIGVVMGMIFEYFVVWIVLK